MGKGPSTTQTPGNICSTCALPAELCVCDTIASEGAPLTVRLDTRRYGKAVTVIEGFEDDAAAKSIGKELKHGLSTGGTAKQRRVELQGDQLKRAKAFLEKKGFMVY